MIIDGHAHIYERLAGYGAKGELRPIGSGKGIWANGETEQFFPEKYGDFGFSAETLLALMKDSDVDHAVLLQGGNYGFQNDYVYEMAKKYPEKFTPAGTLDPCSILAEEILDNLINKYKFKNLKFEISEAWGLSGYHPSLKLDGKEFAPILGRAEKEKMTVTFDLGTWGMSSFQIEELKNIAKKYKNLKIVLSHCFFPKNDGHNDERLGFMKSLSADNFFFDTAILPSFVYPEKHPYPSQIEFLKKAIFLVGAERLIWGSDLPSVLKNFEYPDLYTYITESGAFSEKEAELITSKNAIRAYNIEI